MSKKELNISVSIRDYIIDLAKLAQTCGLDGVVAGVDDAPLIKQACGKGFMVICPGIRPLWADVNDQKRIATPAKAIANGADLLVIGRPVTSAMDKKSAIQRITEEIQMALEDQQVLVATK